MASLCDRCFAPGHCCKGLVLSHAISKDAVVFWDDRPDSIQEFLDEKNFPFIVTEKVETYTATNKSGSAEDVGRTYSAYRYGCKNLLPSGRCGDYENRPDLCRSFEPASDGLCVHYQGAEAGDPTIPLHSF
jgi:Fe-S-cluster containining protein